MQSLCLARCRCASAVLTASITMLAGSASADIVLRGFEEIENGTLWGQQYSEFDISTDTPGALLFVMDGGKVAIEGNRVLVAGGKLIGATANTIFTANGANRFRGFSVNGLSSLGMSVADLYLYDSTSTLITQLSIVAPVEFGPMAIDFSAYSDVARFEVRNVTDSFGIVYDSILIDTNPVPAPGAIALLAVAGLAGRRRR